MASTLIKDLRNVPDIVTGLALGIAEAQRRMNLDYLESLERVLDQARKIFADPNFPADADMKGEVLKMLLSLLPTRYQFTETTMTVRLDLAQSFSAGLEAGVAAGVGAVAVNAALSLGYSQDYRAAAEVQTVLHAVRNDPNQLTALLTRAKELHSIEDKTTLPANTGSDKEIFASTDRILDRITGKKPA